MITAKRAAGSHVKASHRVGIAKLRAFGKLTIVRVTDSTLPPYIVQRKGFQNPTEYANARPEEFRAAPDVAQVTADRLEPPALWE